jgi:hypothetical protein
LGYNIYLVRRSGPEPPDTFSPDEWDRLRATGEVPDWVYFEDGAITVKSPTEEQVRAFARLAEANGWSVQGDDGEAYGVNGVAIPAPAEKPGFLSAALRPLGDLLAGWKLRRSMRDVGRPFVVGDRVRTTFRTGGVVIDVDASANHGLGSIKVRFPDGAVLGGFFVGHDFSKET